ncbi:flagellin-like protein [Thiomicrorhabdus sp. 6S2-11]|uniref:Flagellin n=1 Tax=Thiomicrorhabdus marina TaxID=2818442 RepID=A0ABS3Q1U6_9GAMM|nr:flagellin [Thiomicrorhabdus marina]MBO1926251.1 flagellin-like protein [Thiomicrorhabdus marina]
MVINSYNSLPIPSYNNTQAVNSNNQAIASGSQVNSAADNASGLAVINAFTTQINTQDMASRNAMDGISLLQTADGASSSITAQLQRMNELALQASNGTLNDSQRQILNQEFQQNLAGINEIAQGTTFNQQTLLNGELNTLDIALGETSATLSLPNLTSDGLGLSGLSIDNPSNAATVLQGLGNALQNISQVRSEFGSQQNGLLAQYDNLQSQNLNAQASRSQINDTDYAQAVSEQVRQNILTDAQISMQAQSNQSRASVLQLLNT